VARRQHTSSDYFLGARNLPAWSVLLSIVATETSALTVISVPGLGARGDLAFLQLTFGYLVGRIGVAAWLLPGYFAGTQETAYQRIETRFGVRTRRLLALTFLATRFLGDGVRIFAGAIPLTLVTGWTLPLSIAVMCLATVAYTYLGGLRAVIWADVIQLAIYVTGGLVVLAVAWDLAGGPAAALERAAMAGKLRLLDPAVSFTRTYTLLGGLIGGAMLSAASHGTDQLIVQRLLATRSLRAAQRALIGSGVVVVGQFLLFLGVGVSIWAAGFAPDELPADQILPTFMVQHLPAGVRGLLIAGLLAAAMSTISSSINALASSVTYDLYAGWTGERDPKRLLRVGRIVSGAWGLSLAAAALGFAAFTTGMDTPVVVLALSIASVTYGVLLGTYILAARIRAATDADVLRAAVVTVGVMLLVVFARPLAAAGFAWLEPVGRLAWPWYVPLGTVLAVVTGGVPSWVRRGKR
jgi:SSS family transporter